jgi:hypothetical protein
MIPADVELGLTSVLSNVLSCGYLSKPWPEVLSLNLQPITINIEDSLLLRLAAFATSLAARLEFIAPHTPDAPSTTTQEIRESISPRIALSRFSISSIALKSISSLLPTHLVLHPPLL